jgi:hypothetical protein
MGNEQIGKRVTWGKSPKTGEIVAYVPAGEPISKVEIPGAFARPFMRGAKIDATKIEEDCSQNDRYVVRVGAKWYAPRAKDIDAALANTSAEGA